jgi:hypothetical protein
MILEFGRWADDADQLGEQRRILADTFQAAVALTDVDPSGYVGATVWWTLDDYWTQRPGVKIEHFGLYQPTGDPRPAGLQAAALFGGGAGQGPRRNIVSSGTGSARQAAQRSVRFLGYLAYALTLSLGIPAAILLLLLLAPRRRRRALVP